MNPWAIAKFANGDMLTCVFLSTVVKKQLLMNCVNVHIPVFVFVYNICTYLYIIIVAVLCVLVAFCIHLHIYYVFSVYQSFIVISFIW